MTGIATNERNTQLYVSSSDGTITLFELKLAPEPIVPSCQKGIHDESMSFLHNLNLVAFHNVEISELVFAKPSAPLTAIKLNLKAPGTIQISFQNSRLPILFRERTKTGELMTIHSNEVYLWNSKSWEMVKNINFLIAEKIINDGSKIINFGAV